MDAAAPTVVGRIKVLDVLRGFAVLGILLANIPAFADVAWAYQLAAFTPPLSPTELSFEQWRVFLVSGKFRGALCLLFGVGLYLQHQKLTAKGSSFYKVYGVRMLWLAVIGLLHMFFVWSGDILFMYAIIGLFVMLLAGFSDKVLLWSALGLWMLALGMGSMAVLVGYFSARSPIESGAMLGLDASREFAVFANGSYLDQLVFRSLFGLISVPLSLFHFLLVSPLFLVGIVAARRNVFADPDIKRPEIKIGLGMLLIGLGLNSVAFLKSNSLPIDDLVDLALAMPLAIGYLTVLTLAVHATPKLFVWKPWELVGRTALTSYLGQSLLATFFFYSFGLGYYGQFDVIEQLYVVVGIWIVNIVFAAVWLQFFTMGPVEAVWRSLAAGKRISIRRKATLDVLPEPPFPA